MAYEVRKLSEECHKASQSINASIQEIIGSLTKLKEIMEESDAAFEAQKTAVGDTISSFENINHSVKELAEAQFFFTERMDEVNGKKEELLEVMESIATISSHCMMIRASWDAWNWREEHWRDNLCLYGTKER